MARSRCPRGHGRTLRRVGARSVGDSLPVPGSTGRSHGRGHSGAQQRWPHPQAHAVLELSSAGLRWDVLLQRLPGSRAAATGDLAVRAEPARYAA